MPGDKNREPFPGRLRTMYYGGASYEKSQMLLMLRQLAQRTVICGFDGACCGPSVPFAAVDPVLFSGSPGDRVWGAAGDAAVGWVTCPE